MSTAPSEAPLAPASDSRSDAERDTTALPMVDRVQSNLSSCAMILGIRGTYLQFLHCALLLVSACREGGSVWTRSMKAPWFDGRGGNNGKDL